MAGKEEIDGDSIVDNQEFQSQILQVIRKSCNDFGASVIEEGGSFFFTIHAIQYRYKKHEFEKRQSLYFHFLFPYSESNRIEMVILTKHPTVYSTDGILPYIIFDTFFKSEEQLLEFLPILVEGLVV